MFCDAPLAVCEARDHDGLYARARAGEIQNVTGVDAPYEPPQRPELTLDTANTPAADNIDKVLQLLRSRHLLP